MVPAGYLLKRVLPKDDWLKAPNVTSIGSVSACASPDVVDLLPSWSYNGLGVASDPEVLYGLAREAGTDMSDARLFYYEAYEREIDSGDLATAAWRPLSRLPSAMVDAPVVAPSLPLRLLGYDIVVCEDFISHSPLCCNGVAAELPVNALCLLPDLDLARQAMESGVFNNCEPGVYKIFAVYEVG